MKVIRNLTAMAALAVAVTIASQARADTIDFWLTQHECAGCSATATAAQMISDSSAVEVVVDLLSSTQATVEFIAPSGGTIDTPAYINVNGAITGSSTVEGCTGPSHTCSSSDSVGGITGAGSEDTFGTMTHGTGAVEDYTAVLFTLDLASGTWTDAADVLTPTTGWASNYSDDEPVGFTGFEADSAAQYAGAYIAPVPEPASLALLGAGLVGFGAIRRRRKKTA